MAKLVEDAISSVSATAYTIPTDATESDGTMTWNATTLVIVQVTAGNKTGLGYTYAAASIAALIRNQLAEQIVGRAACDVPSLFAAMQHSVRNLGRSGLVACAVSAVDAAVWDLKARLLDIPLAMLLGRSRNSVVIYGSGGFTNYTDDRLRQQLGSWVDMDGCRFVKMKIGSRPEHDPHRIEVAKSAIGNAELFVDANGAFSAKEALHLAERCADADLRWFEEPVSSDDERGLRLVRERAPATIEIAAGEYIYTADDARRLLNAGAVDVLQADVTRCGISGFLNIAALAESHHIDLSGHCAPSLHRHVACAIPRLRHLEWFHDHVRIEQMLFDGAPIARNGQIEPDLSRPGHGLELRSQDAERFRVAA